MQSGVYSVLQLSTGRHYVGSAVRLDRRWLRHVWDLKNSRHHNSKLQRSWDKYGEDDFRFDILEVCERGQLEAREQFWIDETRPFFNILRKAYSAANFKHSEEALERMSEAQKLVWEQRTPEERSRIVKQQGFTMKGAKHAEETKQKMSATHKLLTPHPNSIRNLLEARNEDPNYGAKIADALATTWYVVTGPDGSEHEVRNLSKFCRDHSLNQGHMSAAARGERRGDNGWLCRRRDNPVKYDDSFRPRYELDGKQLTLTEIVSLVGVHKNTLRHHLNKYGLDGMMKKVELLRAV